MREQKSDRHNCRLRSELATLTGVALLIVFLFSVFVEVAEADHNCCGENCPVCACIQMCENILRQTGSGVVPQFLSQMVIAFFALTSWNPIMDFSENTLVTEKVRLNN